MLFRNRSTTDSGLGAAGSYSDYLRSIGVPTFDEFSNGEHVIADYQKYVGKTLVGTLSPNAIILNRNLLPDDHSIPVGEVYRDTMELEITIHEEIDVHTLESSIEAQIVFDEGSSQGTTVNQPLIVKVGKDTVPNPTQEPESTIVPIPTPTATPIPTASPTANPQNTATPTPTGIPTATPTGSPTATPINSTIPSNTPRPTPTRRPVPTATPTNAVTPVATPAPTVIVTQIPVYTYYPTQPPINNGSNNSGNGQGTNSGNSGNNTNGNNTSNGSSNNNGSNNTTNGNGNLNGGSTQATGNSSSSSNGSQNTNNNGFTNTDVNSQNEANKNGSSNSTNNQSSFNNSNDQNQNNGFFNNIPNNGGTGTSGGMGNNGGNSGEIYNNQQAQSGVSGTPIGNVGTYNNNDSTNGNGLKKAYETESFIVMYNEVDGNYIVFDKKIGLPLGYLLRPYYTDKEILKNLIYFNKQGKKPFVLTPNAAIGITTFAGLLLLIFIFYLAVARVKYYKKAKRYNSKVIVMPRGYSPSVGFNMQ